MRAYNTTARVVDGQQREEVTQCADERIDAVHKKWHITTQTQVRVDDDAVVVDDQCTCSIRGVLYEAR